MRLSRNGFTLVELVLSLAFAMLLLLIAAPSVVRGSAVLRLSAGGQEMVSILRQARAFALRHGAHVAVAFERSGGHSRWAIYRDGDGDGVRRSDIDTGTDPALVPPRAFELRGVALGFPPGLVPTDPGAPGSHLGDLDDPIRFGASDLVSFGPLGTSTPGTLYLTDGRTGLLAVRVLGVTGRIRVMVYDADAESWR